MQRPSSDSVRIFWLDREAVLQELKAAIRRMKATRPEVDVFPYTQAEIDVMLEEGNLFVRQALAEGVALD